MQKCKFCFNIRDKGLNWKPKITLNLMLKIINNCAGSLDSIQPSMCMEGGVISDHSSLDLDLFDRQWLEMAPYLCWKVG